MTGTATSVAPEMLSQVIEGSGHAWVLVLIGVLAIAVGVIVGVTGWHRHTTRPRPTAKPTPPSHPGAP